MFEFEGAVSITVFFAYCKINYCWGLAAGIPDFRSPGTGIYENVQKKYNLLDPQIVFEIGFFRSNPEPFYALAKELVPVDVKPTPSHCFVKLLEDKGLLLRHYTQVICLVEF